MTDNIDIPSNTVRGAADRLQDALKNLEGALSPLVIKVEQLETTLRESESLQNDRTDMAQQLDAAKAKEDAFAAREAEFNALADETMNELDRVIQQVKATLDKGEA